MSWLIAIDRPAGRRQAGDDRVDPLDAAGVLAGRRLVEDHDRRAHREDRGEREQLPARVAEVVRVASRRPRSRPVATSASSTAPLQLRALPPEVPRPERDLAADLARRRSGGPGPGTRARPSAASCGDPAPVGVGAVDEDAALRRPEQAVEVADERRLARAVLADDRDPLAGRDLEVDAVERSRAAGVDVDEALESGSRERRGCLRERTAGSTPRRRQRRPRRDPRRRLDAELGQCGSSKTSAVGPSRTIRPPSIATIRLHRPSSRSVLCSAIRSDVPVAASPRSASPTSRVPAGSSWAVGSSRIDVAWPHREQRRDPDELGLAARQPLRVAHGRAARASAGAIASRVRSTVSATASPRFIGPIAISSKTVAAIPDRCVFGFWKPTTTRSASSCVDRPAAGVAVERQRSLQSRPRSRPAQGPTRRGRASTCPPRSARRARRSRRRRSAGRSREGPRSSSPRSDTSRPGARGIAGSRLRAGRSRRSGTCR